MEELAASREAALGTARVLALLDREMREPWMEDHAPHQLLARARQRAPGDFDLAGAAWLCAEPRAVGGNRAIFGELGIYRPQRSQNDFGMRANPAGLEGHAAALLRATREDTPAARVLGAWRKLAPEINGRDLSYLASCWRFTTGADTHFALRDSLLGPFTRCGLDDPCILGAAGPMADWGGYMVSAELLRMLTPGPAFSLSDLFRALAGGALPRGVALAPGSIAPRAAGEGRGRAALEALAGAGCGVEYLPSGTTGMHVTISLMIGAADARAEVRLTRDGYSGWVLQELSINADGEGARDLMPLLRARHGS